MQNKVICNLGWGWDDKVGGGWEWDGCGGGGKNQVSALFTCGDDNIIPYQRIWSFDS